MHMRGWLLLCICAALSTLLRAIVVREYSSAYPRNYNSGARYYTRYAEQVWRLNTLGYPYGTFYISSYISYKPYYYSGYGYRLNSHPRNYRPVYVGTSYYYFPPMFYYYYRLNSRYWNGQQPRYVCRNDYAFWPLENQTSEFVGGRIPALDLRDFDVDLPTPYFGSGADPNSNIPDPPQPSSYMTELNSLALNSQYKESTSSKTSASASNTVSASISKILLYNYFACPDGKDPEEIYCCGSPTAQYCCSEKYLEDEPVMTASSMRQIFPTVCSIFFGVVITIILIILRRKGIIRSKLCSSPSHSGHHQTRIVTMPNTTVVTGPTATYVAAPNSDSIRLATGMPNPNGPGQFPPVTSYNNIYNYQPVAGAPPPYASIIPIAPTPTAPVGVTPSTGATVTHLDDPAPPYNPYGASFGAASTSPSAPAPPHMPQPSVPMYTGATANWQQQSAAPEQAPYVTGTGEAVSCLTNLQPFTALPPYPSNSTGPTGAPYTSLLSAPPYSAASGYTSVGSDVNQQKSDIPS